jgi:putative methionine-R-sulfoxide reductase with GAF domain
MVKCEIMAPIFVKEKLVAELDIESYFANTFTPMEQDFVENCAAVVGKYFGADAKANSLGICAFRRDPQSGL